MATPNGSFRAGRYRPGCAEGDSVLCSPLDMSEGPNMGRKPEAQDAPCPDYTRLAVMSDRRRGIGTGDK